MLRHPAPCCGCKGLCWSVARTTMFFEVGDHLATTFGSGFYAPRKQLGWRVCQPWFYLRLEAYCFVGLSEGAYGGP
jgi:hypothetical protein